MRFNSMSNNNAAYHVSIHSSLTLFTTSVRTLAVSLFQGIPKYELNVFKKFFNIFKIQSFKAVS